MAAAVGSAPHLGGHAQQAAYNYQNGVSVLEDSEDGDHQYMEHQIAEEEMDHYYQHHYQGQMHPEQLQYHHYQPGDDEDPEEEEMYSDESSDESILPDENIDFSLIYAL
jgi:hypothetical protein